MEMESKSNATKRKALLILNCVLLFIGICVGPLIMRLYYIHGGKRVWLSSWLETGGWPIILIPILINYYRRRRTTSDSSETKKLFFIKPHLFLASAGIGIITGLDNYFYAYGIGRLPVSTSSLIIASQLAFTAVFAFFMVKQKFTSYSINAVVLLTTGAAVLALHTSGDRSKGETEKEYVVGILMTVAAAVLFAFILPLMELTYKKARQEVTYTLVLEMQTVISFFATIVCTVGMFINNDFKVIPREARNFDLGETKYYVVLVWSGIIWQAFNVGAIGVIFCASSLLSAIVIAVALPVTEILAVIFYKESFHPEKGVALTLASWGFVSYFYGEIKHSKKMKKRSLQETENHQIQSPC